MMMAVLKATVNELFGKVKEQLNMNASETNELAEG